MMKNSSFLSISLFGEQAQGCAIKTKTTTSENFATLFRAIDRIFMEAMNHAILAKVLFEEIIIKEKDLRERMLLDVYIFLMAEIDLEDGTPWAEDAGSYRKCDLIVGDTGQVYPYHKIVPILVKNAICSFKADILAAEKSGSLGPFELAAKYCYIFFGDSTVSRCEWSNMCVATNYLSV